MIFAQLIEIHCCAIQNLLQIDVPLFLFGVLMFHHGEQCQFRSESDAEFRAQLSGTGMPAFPVTNVAPKSIHLLTQLGIFTPQLGVLSTQYPDITKQLFYQSP